MLAPATIRNFQFREISGFAGTGQLARRHPMGEKINGELLATVWPAGTLILGGVARDQCWPAGTLLGGEFKNNEELPGIGPARRHPYMGEFKILRSCLALATGSA